MKTRAILIATALAIPASALAHHGWGWTQDEESRLEGTIESISFGNPHMHLQLRTDQAAPGPGLLWEVDLSPPIQARQSGFGPDHAAPGDRAAITGHRARDGDIYGFKGETITGRGRTFDVYPQRDKTLEPG